LVLTAMPPVVEQRSTHAGFQTRELVVTGHGPTVLLLHGFGDSADAWRPVLTLLGEAGQAAIAVDLPGFAQADPLAEGDLLPQLDAFVEAAIRASADATGVVVVGNSLGGAAAARAARNEDLPVAAVMTLGVAGITWNGPTASIGVLAAVLRIVSAIPAPGLVHRTVLRWSLSRLLYGDRSAIDPEVVARFADNYTTPSSTYRLFRQGTIFKAELDRTRQHGGISRPMVVVHGARDLLVPVSASRILHEANPGSRLVVLRSAGHCPQLDAATVVAQHAHQLAVSVSAEKDIS
jgi:pimeloyl-ACP methyl ester carboxylesterase